MVLPHDVRLAAENATKSLASDALKASATGGPEASKAAEAALSEGRLPLALVYARKASEKLEGAEAKCLLGEVLLQAGCPTAALSAFQDAHKLAEGKDSRAATGVALALWHSGAETQSAVEDSIDSLYQEALELSKHKADFGDAVEDEEVTCIVTCSGH